MKIGILTQPFKDNYGGILQAYALQQVLDRMGHESVILNRIYVKPERSKALDLLADAKHAAERFAGRFVTLKKPKFLDSVQYAYVRQNIPPFVAKHYRISGDLISTKELAAAAKSLGIEGFVVGSDQVWRPRYSPKISNYYLDFAEGWDVRRVAYAASFGVDSWEYEAADAAACSRLAKMFDAVSVREESGVALCRDRLGVEAVHVLDPTMLLRREDYEPLSEAGETTDEGAVLFSYVLDMDDDKRAFVESLSSGLGLGTRTCMPKLKPTPENYALDRDACVFPSPAEWIRAFKDAGAVVTDSFHGTVFSIIFNIPFWVLGNPDRGLARIQSLLEMFGLEDRYVADPRNAPAADKPIDWARVNAVREEWKSRSMSFLTSALGNGRGI